MRGSHTPFRAAVLPCGQAVRSGAGDRRERGSSSVEFAILFPVIVALLLAGPS
jgi:hypothetical protein